MLYRETEYCMVLFCWQVEQIMKDTGRDHFMSAPEALEYGIIDKIVQKRVH